MLHTLLNILIALLLLGVVVAFHEFGHFIIAKSRGITVIEFSIGMGPRLLTFEKGGTRYSLKLLPIGGSCLMGEDDTAPTDDEHAFNNKNVWERIAVIFAGPVFINTGTGILFGHEKISPHCFTRSCSCKYFLGGTRCKFIKGLAKETSVFKVRVTAERIEARTADADKYFTCKIVIGNSRSVLFSESIIYPLVCFVVDR